MEIFTNTRLNYNGKFNRNYKYIDGSFESTQYNTQSSHILQGNGLRGNLCTRLYFTPSKLHRMGLKNNLCRKCKSKIGTFLHVIWGCKIRSFWEQVLEHVSRWLGVAVPVSPRLFVGGPNRNAKYI